MRSVIFMVVSVLILSLMGPRAAQARDVGNSKAGVRYVVVTFSDLDLATKHGRDQLDRRIRSAATAVCTAHAGLTGGFLECRGEALRRANAARNQAVVRTLVRGNPTLGSTYVRTKGR